MQKCTLGLGCFWKPEENFKNKPGIIDTEVGYAGGTNPNVTYKEVCKGSTGHAEVVRLTFDNKVKGIKNLAKRIINKSFNPNLIKKMNDEKAIEYLSELRQIGRWSAEMILLFTYNRSNIWPLQDIGLLRAISNNYNKKYFPPKSFLNKLYKKFSPYCSVATWYLWRSIDNEPIQY